MEILSPGGCCTRDISFVRESVRLEKSSYLVGDVTSMEIEEEEGASIQGRMRIEAISEGMLSL